MCPQDNRPPDAEIVVLGEHGVFEADSCVVEDGAVHAEGRWRWRTGPSYRLARYSDPISRSWPTRKVEAIRWAERQAA